MAATRAPAARSVISVRLDRGFGGRNLAQMRAFYLAVDSVDRIVQMLSALSAGIGFQCGREERTRVRRNRTGVSAALVRARSLPSGKTADARAFRGAA